MRTHGQFVDTRNTSGVVDVLTAINDVPQRRFMVFWSIADALKQFCRLITISWRLVLYQISSWWVLMITFDAVIQFSRNRRDRKTVFFTSSD
jgi:hypothetical protein